MGMDEVIKNTIRESINDRLDRAEQNINAKIYDIINRARLRSLTEKDENRRARFIAQLNTAEAIKNIVHLEIGAAKIK